LTTFSSAIRQNYHLNLSFNNHLASNQLAKMVVWDVPTDLKLLMSCLDPESKPNWERVSNAMGDGFTAEACRYVRERISLPLFISPASLPCLNYIIPRIISEF
jgi:hypothetical protein